VANVAHELNNPLAVATLELDHLHEAGGSASWTDDLTTLREAIARCRSVGQRFLTLARQQQPTRRAVSLHTIRRAVRALLGKTWQVGGITIHTHLVEALPLLWADPHQLHHVVATLITNAHHALLETDPPRYLRLTTAVRADRSQVTLEGADSGSGMTQDVQRRVFEPFLTTKPPGVGSGVGLPLCRRIVEGHGGTIHLASQLGHGTTVTVMLPVAAEVPSPETASAPDAPTQKQRGTILLIDDDPGVQRALQRLLQRDGHAITTAANGQEGLAALEAHAYEVILCDVRMPDLDGPGFYRELVRRHPHLVSRLIFVTGDTRSPAAQALCAQVDCPRLITPCKAQEARGGAWSRQIAVGMTGQVSPQPATALQICGRHDTCRHYRLETREAVRRKNQPCKGLKRGWVLPAARAMRA